MGLCQPSGMCCTGTSPMYTLATQFHLEKMVHPDRSFPHGVGEVVHLPSVPVEVLCLHDL